MIEIDGPPTGGFMVADKGEVKYVSLVVGGRHIHDVVRFFDARIEKIKEILRPMESSIIYWRQRPEVRWDEGSLVYKARCRIATEPELSQEFWDDLMIIKKEGEPPVIIE